METPEEEQPKTSREHIAALYGRLEKLEQALSEHMAATRPQLSHADKAVIAMKAGQPVPLDFGEDDRNEFLKDRPGPGAYARAVIAREEAYSYTIDTDASPKDLPFEVALMYAKAGRRIRLKSWSKAFVQMTNTGMWFDDYHSGKGPQPFIMPHTEFGAVDWEVIPREEPEPSLHPGPVEWIMEKLRERFKGTSFIVSVVDGCVEGSWANGTRHRLSKLEAIRAWNVSKGNEPNTYLESIIKHFSE